MTFKLATIRIMEKRDCGQVLRIESNNHHRAGIYTRRLTETKLCDFLGRPGTVGYVIEEGRENVIGFLLADKSDSAECQVVRLAVDPDFARCGFGKMLLDHAVTLNGKKWDCADFAIYCYEEDMESLQFFKRLGWPSRLVRDHFGEDRDAVRFGLSQKLLNGGIAGLPVHKV